MPKISEAPAGLRTFLFHGVALQWSGSGQAAGQCPFCQREGRFYVDPESTKWCCLKGGCGEKGNETSFVRQLHALAVKNTPEQALLDLAAERGLLSADTLVAWGLAVSPLTGEWLVPGYAPGSVEIRQLYRRVRVAGVGGGGARSGGRWVLLATPGVRHCLFLPGGEWPGRQCEEVYFCEGLWDAMALWEALGRAKVVGAGEGQYLTLTGNAGSSLRGAGRAVVLGVPACHVFQEEWAAVCAGRAVSLLYDSDHPVVRADGVVGVPAGWAGCRHAVRVISAAGAEYRPRQAQVLQWGDAGYDPARPSGFDVRDYLRQYGDVAGRVRLLGLLMGLLVPPPEDWLGGVGAGGQQRGSMELELLPCEQYRTLLHAWRRALKWTEGLDRALSVMLAVATSTRLLGDQLWVKVIGPPSSGKSVLCEALSVCKEYVEARSTIRGFQSGYKSDATGAVDHSLIARLRGKTLVTKDGDTLLQSPNLPQILSEGRDLYDTVSRAHYRHGVSRDYEGVRLTWLLCGTESLRTIDSSELGERFLDCVIMDRIDDELEDEIAWRKINQVVEARGAEANGRADSLQDPTMIKAMQMTGGYVKYLRERASRLLQEVEMGEDEKRLCTRLGKFVSYMRARPSKRQDESDGREMSIRLVSQLGRLAMCLAAVLNKQVVDAEVVRRLRRVALDTARGRTMEVVEWLYRAGEAAGWAEGGASGADFKALLAWVNVKEERLRELLRFLTRIKVLERCQYRVAPGLPAVVRWRLTDIMRGLYEEAAGLPGSEAAT